MHLTITRVGPHVERRALPRGRARRRRAGNALRKPFAFGRVPGDGKGAGMTSRTRARGFSFPGWRWFGHCGDLIGQRGSTTREGFFDSVEKKNRDFEAVRVFSDRRPDETTRRNASTTDQLRAFQNSRVHIDDDADARMRPCKMQKNNVKIPKRNAPIRSSLVHVSNVPTRRASTCRTTRTIFS